MSMFQILTQKGWNEVMHLTMYETHETYVFLVAIYFIFYHLFVTLVSRIMFVCFLLYVLDWCFCGVFGYLYSCSIVGVIDFLDLW